MFAKQISLLYQYITITLAFLVFKVSYQEALHSRCNRRKNCGVQSCHFPAPTYKNLLLLKVSCRKMVGIIANRIWITGNAFQSLMPSKFKGIENLCHHLFQKSLLGLEVFIIQFAPLKLTIWRTFYPILRITEESFE